jgi:uncharacterized membrane protein YqhA
MQETDKVAVPAATDVAQLTGPRQSSDELPRLRSVESLVGDVLSSGRYFILLAVLGSFITSCAVLIYAFFAGVIDAFGDAVQHDFNPEGAKHVSVEVISLVDLFLLGTVLYVVAVGLYQLFVNPHLPTPSWLKIRDLDDLKERLLGTIVVLLAVSFLGYVVTWDGSLNLLGVGAAIGVVLVAISLLLREFRGSPRPPKHSE